MTPPDLHMDLEYFLGNVPLFSSVPQSQISDISDCFAFSEFKKNAVVFKQGDSSDSLYIIRSGTVLISSEKNGALLFQTELGRGDFFGEMALVSDLPRNASARVTLDATLFYLKKEAFEKLLSKNRHIGLFLSRLYARRLSSHLETEAVHQTSAFYTVSATDPDLGLAYFLYSMCYHISTESHKKVLVVEPHLDLERMTQKFDLCPVPCPDESLIKPVLSPGFDIKDLKWFYHASGFFVLQIPCMENPPIGDALPLLMERFKHRYDVVVFSLATHFGPLEQQAVRLCDKNLLLINNTAKALPHVKQTLDRLEKSAGTGFDRVRVGVSHLCGSRGIAREALKKELNLSETPQIWVDRSENALRDEMDTEKRFPVKGPRALARELAGVRIGLALGAGAARGWSHIGVLKVLEEEKIPIDMIAGTSMGALVGAIFAATGSVDHLRKKTIDILSTRAQARKKIFDYTLPFQGFLRGKKAMNLVAEAVHHADFMDLVIPTYLVGVDILKGEEILFETGDVAKAVRSSLSLPVVFTPFRHKGRWMVDGGLLNPVPVNILEQKGADKIIAVCVESRRPDQANITRTPGIMGVISRTISIVHGRATSGFARKSDIVIYPDVQGFAWDDFHKGEVMMQRGIRACQDLIREIKLLVQ